MKIHSGTIGTLFAITFIVIILAGHVIFKEMKDRIYQQHVAQFHIDAKDRIKSLNQTLELYAQRFYSFSGLPIFRLMRFHQLTENTPAYKENVRQLELYALKQHRDDNNLYGIRLINRKGKELIRVEQQMIQYNLRDVSLEANTQSALNLPRDKMRVTYNHQTDKITWWLPVYTSNTVNLGVLAFEIGMLPLQSIATTEDEKAYMNIRITDSDNRNITGTPLNSTRTEDPDWTITHALQLPGLQWNIIVNAKTDTILQGITRLEQTVYFVITPLIAILLLALGALSVKKVRMDRKIHHMAYFDHLTGLFNRVQFEENVSSILQLPHNPGTQHALLYMDLDQFKVINDTCGHIAGDQLLKQVSRLLKQQVRENDILARMGGDEFTLLLENCPEHQAQLLANEILHTLTNYRFIWNKKSFGLGISIGIAVIDTPQTDYETVLQQADIACHMAKEMGRNRIHTFSAQDQEIAKRHGEMQWVSRLKQTLDRNLFSLDCQQIVPLGSNDNPLMAWEVFVRIREGNNVIFPDAFIPSAERYGLMPQIDRWVINETFSQIEDLNLQLADHSSSYRFFINLSALTISDKKFYPFLQKCFKKHNVQPNSICFEITETSAIADITSAVEFINSVRELGCYLALDDFGSGLCSFSYLKMLPVDYIKIDGTYVEGMLNDPMNNTIVEVIQKIGRTASLKTIAEFASSKEILQRLRDIGIDYAQGYAIEKPHPLVSLELARKIQPNGKKGKSASSDALPR